MISESPLSSSPGAARFWEPFIVFLKLGLTSFGGPLAHLGFFRKEIVEKRKWVTETAYADLVALCQFLPGPASSQVGFSVGYLRGGISGAFAAWLGFTLPSALIMIGCAYGLGFVTPGAGWLHGLKIAAVAVVAQAVWSMARALCPDRARAVLALFCAIAVLAVGTAWMQVLVIGLGLVLGRWLCPGAPAAPEETARAGHLGWGYLAGFFALFFGLPLVAWGTQDKWMLLADGFYRAGSLVFGGGHVVLPLLEAETVGRGWMTRDAFLAGYGAAQALPGPLFTLAAYLGAVMMPEGPGWLAGLWCLGAILLPSFLLVLGVLPFWQRLRALRGAQAALKGANAAVVGILLAAFYDPVCTAAIDSTTAAILAVAAWIGLEFGKVPAWALVGICALAGGILLGK
jgi:chromate transporter